MDLITQFYVTVGLMVFSGALGWYIGERSWQGVQNDINNVKLDIAHIQGKLSGTQATEVITPVAGSQTPHPTTVISTPSI